MNAKITALSAQKTALLASRTTPQLLADLKVLEKMDDEMIESSIKTKTRLWVIDEIEARHPEISDAVDNLFLDDDVRTREYSFYLEHGLKQNGLI